MTRHIIIHYDEIALKGKKRARFEDQLVANLNGWLKSAALPFRARRSWGRIFIDPLDGADWAAHEDALRARLRRFPGVSSFGFAFACAKTPDALFASAEKLATRARGGTFRATAKRVDKSFPLSSQEIEREYGAAMLRAEPTLKVSLKHYDAEARIEVLDRDIVVYLKERGIGGLAVGSSGRIVALLSAGFDSPVASFLLMKRGARMFPLHFHASELTTDEPLEAVRDLCVELSQAQGPMKLALVSVTAIQDHIAAHAPSPLRIILLRRSFLRMAERHAATMRALALATGDSLGQVASQTLENMRAIDEAATLPVLRPLVGLNKTQIIDLARFIGTADISARPCADTCAMFVPKQPETRARLRAVLEAEEAVIERLRALEEEALAAMRIWRFAWGRQLEEDDE